MKRREMLDIPSGAALCRMLLATLWMLHVGGSGAVATAAQATYKLGFLGWEVTENGVTKTLFDKYQEADKQDCVPLDWYSSDQLGDWLEKIGFDVNRTAAAMIDGRSLVAMTSAPNALSKDSALFNLHLVSGFDGGSYTENSVVGAASLVYLVESVQNSLTAPLMGLPPFMDPCSSLYRTKEGSDVEVLSLRPPPPAPPLRLTGRVCAQLFGIWSSRRLSYSPFLDFLTALARQVSISVEKVLSLDVDAYTFEVIFSVGYMWLEDRVYNLPEATPQEMEDCPEVSKCGFCDFKTGRTCHVRNANGFTNPRTGKAAGVNKCCKDLWNPLMSEGLPWDGVIWPNAKETEILYQDGPTYTDVCRQKITGTSEYLDRLCIANYNNRRFPATSKAARSPAAGRRGGKKAAGDADTAKKAKTSGKTATGRATRGVGGEEDAGRPKRRVGFARGKKNLRAKTSGKTARRRVRRVELPCVDLPGFEDSAGDTCEVWAANPTWCDGWDPKDGDIGPPADYANADGIDPGTACCVCQNQSRSEDKEGQDNEDEGWISASGHRNWDMDGPSVAFAEVRMRGVFYIPMDFQVFPTDTQVLDIHMSTKAYTWQFNLSNISHNGNATGDYVAGGPDMPVAEKKRLGLDANPRCPRHPSTAESENNSSMTYFEDLSGWSISKNVQVLRFQADDQNCLTSSPCNASRPSKFSLQHELNVMRNIPFNTPLSAEERESQQRSFIVFRMTVCRRTTYYVENVLTVIILLNIINVLSLLLSPEDVETRLGSCGTMVLALAALQAFVTSSVPSVGYSTHGQAFVQISNILMIAAALESVFVYQGCKQRFCLLRLLRFDPEGDLALSEMLVWDHMFIIFYCMLLVYYVDKYFRDAMEGLFVPGLTVCIVALLLVLIFHFFRLGQELLRLKQSNSGAGKTKDSTTERKSETAKRIEICFASRPELLQYSQMFDDHVIAPSQLKDLTVEELSQVMKIPLGHAKSMPALFQACHPTELAGDAMEKCVQSPDLTQSNTESMTPERDMRVMDRDASLMTTAAAGAGERPAFEESETTLASETHSTVRDGIV